MMCCIIPIYRITTFQAFLHTCTYSRYLETIGTTYVLPHIYVLHTFSDQVPALNKVVNTDVFLPLQMKLKNVCSSSVHLQYYLFKSRFWFRQSQRHKGFVV